MKNLYGISYKTYGENLIQKDDPHLRSKLECKVFVGFIGLEADLREFILVGRLR